MPRRLLVLTGLLINLAASSLLSADETGRSVADATLARLPVKEITVFKDGHAFVLHEGTLPTDDTGHVYLDHLPAPVLGTFWPYAADPAVTLESVVAGKKVVTSDRTALSIRELLEANIGGKVLIKEDSRSYAATIVALPRRDRTERERAGASTTAIAEEPAQVILLQTAEGFKVVNVDVIRDVTFLEEPKLKLAREDYRDLLALNLVWKDGERAPSARVGMAYLQKGIRWIPNYKITIDGNGRATVALQATLLNELTDLDDVTAHLVVGVPSFYFKDTRDPIGLRQVVAQLSAYFQDGAQTGYALSNAMMTQVARMSEYQARQQPAPAEAPVDLGPAIGDSGKREDLFVFTVEHITLKQGERMVLPVLEFPLEYKDVYKLEFPFGPPPDVRRQFTTQQQAELARLFHSPKAVHHLRLTNTSRYPLTTAPALIVHGGRLLGQALMTYTAAGASVDLEITTAVDIAVEKTDREVRRLPDAATWSGDAYDRIELEGALKLTNYRGTPVELEIVRNVLGNATAASGDGSVTKLNMQDFESQLGSVEFPYWWNWYSWPYWWHHLNGISQMKWNVTLEPGKAVELNHQWHYFWRG